MKRLTIILIIVAIIFFSTYQIVTSQDQSVQVTYQYYQTMSDGNLIYDVTISAPFEPLGIVTGGSVIRDTTINTYENGIYTSRLKVVFREPCQAGIRVTRYGESILFSPRLCVYLPEVTL